MTRFVTPLLFDAQVAPPEEAFLDQAIIEELGQILEEQLPPSTIPVSIRWRLKPEAGLPNGPFRVWRRKGDDPLDMIPLPVNPTTVTNNAKIHWDWTSLYILELQAIPNPGLSMTIMALDNTGKAIDGEEVTVFGNSIVRFRHANICAVGVRGSGEVKNFNGVTMNSFVNDPNWQLIEVVGLPVQVGEADPDAYDTEDLQGRSGSLRPGDDAARMRLQVGAILANTPPATTPGGTSTPTWPIANPDIVLNDEIRGGNPSLLEMILEMLQSLDPNQLGNAQSDFLRPVDTPGMQQPGGPASSEQATLELPVAGLVMLGAATDYWAALGYGFGTTDFPDFRETEGGSTPPGPMMSAHDYMITYMKRYPFGLELEVAAPASVVRLPVPAPHNFAASLWLQNRPIIRDSTGDHDVTLSWERPRKYAPPGGYALAIMTGGNPANLLNKKRPAGGFLVHVPASNTNSDEFEAGYMDPRRITPLTGTRTDTYMGARLDVFGRWSEWADTTFTIGPLPPGKPQILGAEFQMNPAAAAGRIVPAALQIDLTWDWEDRSPQKIEIVGAFYSGGALPDPIPGGIEFGAGGMSISPLELTFPSNNIDQTPNVTAGHDIELLPGEPDDGDTRRYRVTINGYNLDFNATSRYRFAVYARASEKVIPTVFGDYCNPASAVANDPLPADPPAMVLPDINWTALPDATGIARYKLTFNAVPQAAGYVVYEATEAAIREAAGLGAITDPNLIPRAIDMENVAGNVQVLDAYSRVNRELLPNPEVELELPGASNGLTVYRVSSVTSSQVESGLSAPILVAVPRRDSPGIPSLSARSNGNAVNIKIIQGNGPTPAEVELYRTRSSILVGDINEMGPPVADGTAGWQVSTDADGRQIFELADGPTPSWRPYLYRAVAIGRHDEVNGLFPGRSGASPTIEAMLLPPNPPDLQPISASATSGNEVVVQFRSLAERRIAPLGIHQVTVLTVNRLSTYPENTVHAQADLSVIPEESEGSPATIGEIKRKTFNPDNRWTYETVVPRVDDEIVVRLRDPLGRTSEERVAMPPPPPPPGPTLEDLTLSTAISGSILTLTITCRSDVPTSVPILGGYLLSATVMHTTQTTVEEFIHNIPVVGLRTIGEWGRSKMPMNNFHTYTLRLTFSIFDRIKEVIVQLTDPGGNTTELRSDDI